MERSEKNSWSPYLAGSLTGAAIILSAWTAKQYFGASTCFVRIAGFMEQLFIPGHVTASQYFSRFAPYVDWQVMMVLGILIGSFIGAITSGRFRIRMVPDLWKEHFGPSRVKRGVIAFIGGIILMFGARLAGGCPSGYGLGALVQTALSGLIVIACFFAGGIITANIFHGGGKK